VYFHGAIEVRYCVQVLKSFFLYQGMGILRAVHNSFENWAVTLCRGGKLEAARFFAERLEKFVVDNGLAGAGKTFLQSVAEQSLGTYAVQLKEELLTKDPPNASAPDPALLALRGCRSFATPEMERTKKVKASWVKKLADPSTRWSARDLFEKGQVEFYLYGLFSMSVNNGVEFTRTDAGVTRRCIGCPYELHFCDNPQLPHEREWLKNDDGSQTDMKDAQWLLSRIPGWLVWILAAHKVCFGPGGHGLGKLPLKMAAESAALVKSELTDLISGWVLENTEPCAPALGMTRPALLTALKRDSAMVEYSTSDVLAAVESIVEVAAAQGGRRNLVRVRETGKFFKLQ
jgi:hypothetical protein